MNSSTVFSTNSPSINREEKHVKDEKSSGRSGNDSYDTLSRTVKACKDKNMSFNGLLNDLQEAAVTELKKGTALAHEGVRLFIAGEPKQSKAKEPKEQIIDDCVRWNLLLRSVDNENGSSDAADIQANKDLSMMIVEQKAYLAFECPYKGKSEENKTYKSTCIDHRKHDAYKAVNTPFRIAAKCRNSAVIKTMISSGKAFYEGTPTRHEFKGDGKYWPFWRIVQQNEPGNSGSKKEWVLSLAMGDGQGSLETLEELLKVDGIIPYKEDGQEDETFEKAIDGGLLKVVEIFLHPDQPKLVEAYATSQYILRALGRLAVVDVQKRAVSDNRSRIVRLLVLRAKKRGVLNYEVVEGIIKTGLKEIWDAIHEGMLLEDVEARLLHLAVRHQKHDFVKLFLAKYPNSVKEKQAVLGMGDEKHYPLWYNNYQGGSTKPHGSNAEDVKKRIRTDIVNKMIHEVSDIETLTDIFYDSEEPVGELCFDMSGFNFNSASYRVSKFVDSLIWQSQRQKLLSYEQTLRYAEFPSLDMLVEERETFTESGHLQLEHTEVFKILDWLKGRGVETIIDLRIPDRLVNPHDDKRMAALVDQFKVELLDWKVLDLPISVLGDGTRERIKQLHLYSSGNRAVISHWFSEDGIPSLKNLEKLEIKIVQETCTSKRCSALNLEIREKCRKFAESKKLLAATSDQDLTIPKFGRLESVPWFPTPKLADLSLITHRVAPKLAQWLKAKDISTKVEQKKRDGNYKPTKVAILDNGILSISPFSYSSDEDATLKDDKERLVNAGNGRHADASIDSGNGNVGNLSDAEDEDSQYDDSRSLWKRIKEGRSFVDGHSRLSPWSFATNPHGTQMANLICAIDPYCELYVARVAEDTMGITSKRVAQAIAWARSRKVDVISMSFIIGEDKDERMLHEIGAAHKDGIMMTCSAHDEGIRLAKAWPASYHEHSRSLITLAACDEYGKILREADDTTYDYLIKGQDIAAGVIPFLKSADTITGSSVSTAIAAGLSSLILTCDRLGKPKKSYPKSGQGSRYQLITSHLDKMTAPKSRFVLLENFNHLLDLIC